MRHQHAGKKTQSSFWTQLLSVFALFLSMSVTAQTALPLPSSLLSITGVVSAIAVQSNGQVVIGGYFTAVNNVTRNNIARLNADGSVDMSWNPGADNHIYALATSGNIVYAGGSFSNIGGQQRTRIAALDQTTGLASSWNSSADNDVYALAVSGSGSVVYVAGVFTHVGTQARNYLAAIDASSGLVTAWNPAPSDVVHNLAASGNTLYAMGSFQTIGGQPRNAIAAIDGNTGFATAWNPALTSLNSGHEGTVLSIAISGNILYVGGEFSAVGNQTRLGLAAIDTNTGLATSWNPAGTEQSSTSNLAVAGNTVYAYGPYSHIGGQAQTFLAAIDATTGLAKAWNPVLQLGKRDDPTPFVLSLAATATTVYLGGSFRSINGTEAGGFASIDATSGNIATLPQVQSAGFLNVNQSQPDGKIIIGGLFSSINGVVRKNIARINIDGSVDTSWNPGANDEVTAFAISGNTIYIGGFFSMFGGQPRASIAAADMTTGLATAWNPNADGPVFALTIAGSTVYAGGVFEDIGGQQRFCLAALDATTGALTAWNPYVDGSTTRDYPFVSALFISGNTMYVGGDFSIAGGQYRNDLAAIDLTTGMASAWNPVVYASSSSDCNSGEGSSVDALSVRGNTVYIAGMFDSIGGQSRSCLAAVDATTGLATAWNPHAIGGKVSSLVLSGSTAYVAGFFNTVGGQSRGGLAALDTESGLADAWNPAAQLLDEGQAYGVYNVGVWGGTVYVGGGFTSIAGQPRPGIAALTPTDQIFHAAFD